MIVYHSIPVEYFVKQSDSEGFTPWHHNVFNKPENAHLLCIWVADTYEGAVRGGQHKNKDNIVLKINAEEDKLELTDLADNFDFGDTYYVYRTPYINHSQFTIIEGS